MSLVTKEINRRRHIRWQISKTAVLFVPGSQPLACVIYDFCSSGLFLEFQEANEKKELRPHQQVKIFFSANADEGESDFEFDVEIMRVCDNGIGVAFQHIPMSAFRALVKEANLETVPVSLGGTDHLSGSVKRIRFEKLFKKLLNNSLPLILKDFFLRVDQEMIKKAGHAERQDTKAIYFSAFETLKKNRKSIVPKFCNSLLKEIRYIDNSISDGKADCFIDEDNQSVVNEDEMSDWIDLSSIIHRVESRYGSKLELLEQQLSHITGIPANQINNPLTPAKLFYSFREAIDNPDGNNEVRKSFYKIFEQVLNSQLDQLYDHFDSLLVDQGAPEQVDSNNSGQPLNQSTKENRLQHSMINQEATQQEANEMETSAFH